MLNYAITRLAFRPSRVIASAPMRKMCDALVLIRAICTYVLMIKLGVCSAYVTEMSLVYPGEQICTGCE